MKSDSNKREDINFDKLVQAIQHANKELSSQAKRAVNTKLIIRNWLIGYYIHEYELHGSDRAKYREKLLVNLAESLKHVSNCNRRQLYDYLALYRVYPQIGKIVSAQLQHLLLKGVKSTKVIVPTVSAQLHPPPEKLLSNFSYSIFKLLSNIEDDTKRAFYEVECMQGSWSVRELQRQINSLYYERSGLSLNKEILSELAHQDTEKAAPQFSIRDPYVFEFLGLKSKEVMCESHLENELLDKIEIFLLELGHGFCFEARQKRILIGNTHNFIDLVFYHRILKCHVLVELKLAEFSHENIGQLNTYVSWYKKNIMTEGDSLPIGILLCTNKDHALAGMDDNLFISKYLLELPQKDTMQKFIEEKLREKE